jgi:hypothetical protein
MSPARESYSYALGKTPMGSAGRHRAAVGNCPILGRVIGPQHAPAGEDGPPVMYTPATDAHYVTQFGIPDSIGGPGPTTGTRPIQCLIWGAAGRQDARAGEEAPVDAQRGPDAPTWPDSLTPRVLVASSAAGFGSLTVRSIRNAAK